MRREAEQSLQSKEREIGQIQDALVQTRGRLDALKADADAQILKKEQELRASFDEQLAAEKRKLQAQGASAASIDAQLVHAARAAAEVLRRAARGVSKAGERGRRATGGGAQRAAHRLQKVLAQAQAEKAQLQSKLEEASRTATSAQGEQARLAQQVAVLSAQDQREQLVLDQISASYAAAGAAMKGSRFDDALASLGSLASYLDQAGVASLPAVQRRKSVDLFLIDSLEKLIVSQKAGAQPAAAANPASGQAASGQPVATVQAEAPLASPRQTQAAAEAIAAADALFAAGSFAAALEKYDAALALLGDIPGMDRVAARISEAGYRQREAERTAGKDKVARPALEKADALLRRGSYAEAIAAYATVVRNWPDSSYVNRSLTGIDGAVSALLKKRDDDATHREEARRTAAGEKLAAVASGLSSTARAADASVAAAQKELIALLDAKVKIKTVLASEAVKTQYPGLAESLDRYLQLYGEQSSAAGRIVALQDVGMVLDFLTGARGREALAPIGSRYGDQSERTAFQQLIERLKGLFK